MHKCSTMHTSSPVMATGERTRPTALCSTSNTAAVCTTFRGSSASWARNNNNTLCVGKYGLGFVPRWYQFVNMVILLVGRLKCRT